MKFNDIKKRLKKKSKKISVTCPYGDEVMNALESARKENLADSILVGNKEKIVDSIDSIGADKKNYEIVDIKDVKKAAKKSVKLVSEGTADALMKGKIQTSTFMKAALNKKWGLRTGSLLSHITVYECENYHKLLFVTDGGIVIEPSIKEKLQIIDNAVDYVRRFDIKTPKIAAVAHKEGIDQNVKATTDAAMLAKMSDRGQIKNALVDGPFGFDNAVSKRAAKVKNIESEVAGDADILLVPDVVSGNLMAKAIMYMGNGKYGGVVLGAKSPIILLSRADDAETKFNSVMLGLL